MVLSCLPGQDSLEPPELFSLEPPALLVAPSCFPGKQHPPLP